MAKREFHSARLRVFITSLVTRGSQTTVRGDSIDFSGSPWNTDYMPQLCTTYTQHTCLRARARTCSHTRSRRLASYVTCGHVHVAAFLLMSLIDRVLITAVYILPHGHIYRDVRTSVFFGRHTLGRRRIGPFLHFWDNAGDLREI